PCSRVRRAFTGIAVTTAAGGEEGDAVAGGDLDLGDLLHRGFAAVGAADETLIDGARLAAMQAPGRIAGAIEVDVGPALLQQLVGQLDAEPAAEFAGAAGVNTQAVGFDQHRIFDLLQLDRRVAHVALADRHRGRFAVFVGPAAPAAAENIH